MNGVDDGFEDAGVAIGGSTSSDKAVLDGEAIVDVLIVSNDRSIFLIQSVVRKDQVQRKCRKGVDCFTTNADIIDESKRCSKRLYTVGLQSEAEHRSVLLYAYMLA